MLADSILKEVDRQVLAGLIADYLYLKSKGMSNVDYASFEATRSKLIKMSISAFFVFTQGLIFDKEFRSVTINALIRSVSTRLEVKSQPAQVVERLV
jgi:hypothetical protein